MSAITGQWQVPIIVDPGGDGWPTPPKVSSAEVALFGDHAEAVRLLGQAAVATADAYALTCKGTNEHAFTDDAEAFYRELAQVTWQLQQNAQQAYREVAEKAIAKRRSYQPCMPAQSDPPVGP